MSLSTHTYIPSYTASLSSTCSQLPVETSVSFIPQVNRTHEEVLSAWAGNSTCYERLYGQALYTQQLERGAMRDAKKCCRGTQMLAQQARQSPPHRSPRLTQSERCTITSCVAQAPKNVVPISTPIEPSSLLADDGTAADLRASSRGASPSPQPPRSFPPPRWTTSAVLRHSCTQETMAKQAEEALSSSRRTEPSYADPNVQFEEFLQRQANFVARREQRRHELSEQLQMLEKQTREPLTFHSSSRLKQTQRSTSQLHRPIKCQQSDFIHQRQDETMHEGAHVWHTALRKSEASLKQWKEKEPPARTKADLERATKLAATRLEAQRSSPSTPTTGPSSSTVQPKKSKRHTVETPAPRIALATLHINRLRSARKEHVALMQSQTLRVLDFPSLDENGRILLGPHSH